MTVSDPKNPGGWGHQLYYPHLPRLGLAPWPDWAPIGPADYPDVVLGARVALDGVKFQLLAMRVHSPNTAGWTGYGDRTDLDETRIVWNLAGERAFYRALSQLSSDSPDPLTPDAPQRTPAMAEWERWWEKALHRAYGWTDDLMVPIRYPEKPDAAYLVVGYPTEDDSAALSGRLGGIPYRAPADSPVGWEMDGLIQIGDGLLLFLTGVRVRALTTGQTQFVRAWDGESADKLADWKQLITEGPCPGAIRTINYEGASWLAILSSIPDDLYPTQAP